MKNSRDQIIALAAIFQAVNQIEKLARQGISDSTQFLQCFQSLFSFDADSAQAIYGNISNLADGLKLLEEFLSVSSIKASTDMPYYCFSAIKISERILKSADIQELIQQGLLEIQKKSSDFELPVTIQTEKVESLYRDTISNIKPRIMVKGDQRYLSVNENTAKIRALLFCAIRAAVLWRQSGGSKWKIIFSRKALLHQTTDLLTSIADSANISSD